MRRRVAPTAQNFDSDCDCDCDPDADSDSDTDRTLHPLTPRIASSAPALLLAVVALLAATILPGCSGFTATDGEELSRFERAGPYRPEVDVNALLDAKLAPGPYRVRPGDILEMEMPAVMRALLPEETDAQKPHLCRVSAAGTITLPMVGEIDALDKPLAEIEAAAVAAYFPRFTVHRPAIVATVKEFSTVNVTVTGAVNEPGIYALSSEERSLVGALMKAGGILEDGAGAIKIYKHDKKAPSELVVLPVVDLNIPFADAGLTGGETIEVLRLNPEVFTVVGLVSKPGTYEYPPGAHYNLLNAIGFGGGVDMTSSPHWVQIFRQDASGEILTATFDISGDRLPEAAGVRIKQGDIVAVADTLRTQARRIISNIVRGGFYVGYNLNNN